MFGGQAGKTLGTEFQIASENYKIPTSGFLQSQAWCLGNGAMRPKDMTRQAWRGSCTRGAPLPPAPPLACTVSQIQIQIWFRDLILVCQCHSRQVTRAPLGQRWRSSVPAPDTQADAEGQQGSTSSGPTRIDLVGVCSMSVLPCGEAPALGVISNVLSWCCAAVRRSVIVANEEPCWSGHGSYPGTAMAAMVAGVASLSQVWGVVGQVRPVSLASGAAARCQPIDWLL